MLIIAMQGTAMPVLMRGPECGHRGLAIDAFAS
jgi:hypothetical protein